MLTISGFSWARRHKRKFDAVITIEDPGTKNGLRFHLTPHPDHLVLQFVDLDSPIPGTKFKLADSSDIIRALDFSENRNNILIHCRAGISRSTAIAFVILCRQYGIGGEQTALSKMLELQPIAVPNRQVILLADDILGRHGEMIRILDSWDQSVQQNSIRRLLNRQIYLFSAKYILR